MIKYTLEQGIGEPIVRITDDWIGIDMALNRATIEEGIKNTKAGKGGYKTQDAYNRALRMYEGALAFLTRDGRI